MSTFNASDTRHLRRAAKAAKIADNARGEVILSLMSSPSGRAYVHDFLLRCHVFQTPFTGDRSTTDFACGEQNIGLQLLAEVIRFAPDQYIQMMREAQDKDLANERSNERSNNPGPERSESGFNGHDSGSVESEYEPGAESAADAD